MIEISMSHKKAQKAQRKLATDFTDFADLFGHKKVQKTSAFAKATADRRREIRRRLPKFLRQAQDK
jgi:hypothetical protein